MDEYDNEPPDGGVQFPIVGHRAVPRVVSDEHALLPKHSQRYGSEHVRKRILFIHDQMNCHG